MDTKLTIKLDDTVIKQAKLYAKGKNISLSGLIESYLSQLIEHKDNVEISPVVKSLSGVVKLPKHFDEKKEYKKHLANKYK